MTYVGIDVSKVTFVVAPCSATMVTNTTLRWAFNSASALDKIVRMARSFLTDDPNSVFYCELDGSLLCFSWNVKRRRGSAERKNRLRPQSQPVWFTGPDQYISLM